MRLVRLLALALIAAGTPARGEDEVVRWRLALHGRFTDRQNTPDPTVLFDRAARGFDLDRYLRPQGSDAYGSTLLSIGADGRAGWFRFGLAIDTGELRTQQFPELAPVCPAGAATPTGLEVAPSLRCALRGVQHVQETRLAPARVTSNGRPFQDELSSTLLVREAWAGAVFGENEFALVKAGRKRFTVADGFVFDDYGTGIEATFDLGAIGPSFDLGAALFYPTREFPHASGVTSPMLALRADYLPSLFEHAGLFLALYRDKSDSVAELFRGALLESSVVRLLGTAPGTVPYRTEDRLLLATLGSRRSSDGTLGWAGTSGSLVLGDLGRADWTGALGFGHVTLSTAAQEVESSIFGQLAWLRLRRTVFRAAELYGFFLFISGDLPPTEKARLGLPERYGGFLGIAPYVTATNVFFSGGVSESFAARQATAPGVNGRGVLGPGIGASWEPSRAFSVDARAAYLVAEEVGPFGGRVYGPEADLEIAWSPARWITFLAEADALFAGDFFPSRSAITKVVFGVDLVAP